MACTLRPVAEHYKIYIVGHSQFPRPLTRLTTVDSAFRHPPAACAFYTHHMCVFHLVNSFPPPWVVGATPHPLVPTSTQQTLIHTKYNLSSLSKKQSSRRVAVIVIGGASAHGRNLSGAEKELYSRKNQTNSN